MKIDELIKQAFAEKNKAKQNAYKNVKAELQKVLTAKNAPEYSEEVFIKTVSKYMKCNVFPALDTLAKLCAVLDVSSDYILGLNNEY